MTEENNGNVTVGAVFLGDADGNMADVTPDKRLAVEAQVSHIRHTLFHLTAGAGSQGQPMGAMTSNVVDITGVKKLLVMVKFPGGEPPADAQIIIEASCTMSDGSDYDYWTEVSKSIAAECELSWDNYGFNKFRARIVASLHAYSLAVYCGWIAP